MAISLMKLPYALDALEPHVSAATLKQHHGAHHKGYVDKVNKAVAGSDMAEMALEQIVAAARKSGDTALFKLAAQTWNHGFYWPSLSPDRTKPSNDLAGAIRRDFGAMANLGKALIDEADGHFASGWAWLVAKAGKLEVVSTHDADTLLTGSATPLLTIDVWEHAYYLDAKSKRADYLGKVVKDLLNWDFASENFARGSAWTYPS